MKQCCNRYNSNRSCNIVYVVLNEKNANKKQFLTNVKYVDEINYGPQVRKLHILDSTFRPSMIWYCSEVSPDTKSSHDAILFGVPQFRINESKPKAKLARCAFEIIMSAVTTCF